MQSETMQTGGTGRTSDTSFFGHPRGLATLFFVEMWERFSYYGMRALLILYMTASAANGGLGFDLATAGAVYGLYTSSVYLLSLPGGWVADRILGQRRAVFLGGILIILGQLCLGIYGIPSFYFGLLLLVLGTGLLKPNVSTIVGQLYAMEDRRRDAGFSIFYMGINTGAFLSPLLIGWVGQKVNWNLGFALAGVGMVIGLIQYHFGAKHLGDAGLYPVKAESEADDAKQRTHLIRGILAGSTLLAVPFLLNSSGILAITAEGVANAAGIILILAFVGVFGWLLTSKSFTIVERKRFAACLLLFIASVMFWSAFEQAGSTLNLFADRSTKNEIFGFDFPSSWYQSLNSAFMIFGLAPAFAWLWVRLGSREPSSPMKFVFGLLLVGAGFLVMVFGAIRADNGVLVSPFWLTLTYFLHTCGELCLSPVGLSAFAKLAPPRVAGLMMGVFFLSISIGNYVGGRVASVYEVFSTATLFGVVAAFCIGLGVLMILLVPSMKRLMGGVH
ncbi:MAG: oligopeptide:H+ symporter [Bryobacteraceae bacterium]